MFLVPVAAMASVSQFPWASPHSWVQIFSAVAVPNHTLADPKIRLAAERMGESTIRRMRSRSSKGRIVMGANDGAANDKAPTAPVPDATVWDCNNLSLSSSDYWRAQSVQLKASEDERVGKAAGVWATTLTAIAGVAAITAILTSYDRLRATPTNWQIGITIALVAALTAVSLAILFAFRAQAGSLRTYTQTPTNICNYALTEPKEKIEQMRHSRFAALVSLILLVGAIVAIGFAPEKTKYYIGLPETGPAICGTLATEVDGSIILTSSTAGTDALPLTGNVELKDVSSCDLPA
jgi:hypothetical protein